ncbi:MAG: ATPase domain-containing protein [Methanobacteriota archaeon]
MADSFQRVPSGIPGLDEMLDGGFPFPSVILLAGSAGTGKTTFCQKFLSSGADAGEQCLYLTTLSEPTQWMLRFATQFSYVNKRHFGKEIVYVDMGELVRKGKPADLLSFVDEQVGSIMPQRIVIDPITVVGDFMEKNYRSFLFDLSNKLKNWRAVTILTGEVKPGDLYPAEAAYATDGVILLRLLEEDGARRKYIEVLKMRGTNHTSGRQCIDITKQDGIVVLKSKF